MHRIHWQRRILALTFALSAVVLLATPAQAHPVRFFNQSGYEITEFYVRHTGNGNWGRDILGDGTRPTGQYLDLGHANQCQWDIGMRLDGQWWMEFGAVNLCGELTALEFVCDADGCELLPYYE